MHCYNVSFLNTAINKDRKKRGWHQLRQRDRGVCVFIYAQLALETTNLWPDCGTNAHRWSRILWKDSAQMAEAAGAFSLERKTWRGYSQCVSVVPAVWHVPYLLTAVSLTMKNKQSCGSVLVFLQPILPVSRSVGC